MEAYRRIGEERMGGLPIFNKRLEVEAVGFTEWEGHLLGVLIAPWFMNLVLLPGEEDEWSDLKLGTKNTWVLPSGKYEFSVCPSAEAGPHQSLSLFTTVVDIPCQEIACGIAQAVMDRVLSKGMEQKNRVGKATKKVTHKSASRRDLLRKFVSKGK